MQEEKLTIKDWADDDKPREKLLAKGHQNLSDAELLAIIMGSGNRNETAVDLAKKILSQNNSNIAKVSKLSISDLMKYKGIGEAKAVSIIAAFELGRRVMSAEVEKTKISCAEDIFRYMCPYLCNLDHEEFWVVYLNNSNSVLHTAKIAQGGMTATTVDQRIIFRTALEKHAVSIILCHNHPSGNLKPSTADIKLTEKIKNAGNLIDIKVLDHIIFADDKFYSFANERGI